MSYSNKEYYKVSVLLQAIPSPVPLAYSYYIHSRPLWDSESWVHRIVQFHQKTHALTLGTSAVWTGTTFANSGGGGAFRRLAPKMSWSLNRWHRDTCIKLGGTSLKGSIALFSLHIFQASLLSTKPMFSSDSFLTNLSQAAPLHLRRACRSCNFNRKICRSCVRSSRGKPRSQAILPLKSLIFTGRWIPQNSTSNPACQAAQRMPCPNVRVVHGS